MMDGLASEKKPRQLSVFLFELMRVFSGQLASRAKQAKSESELQREKVIARCAAIFQNRVMCEHWKWI